MYAIVSYMNSKVQEKEMVIALRKQGMTYKQILERVPVSKSSVSMWLKDSVLTEAEMRVLKRRKDSGISRGRIRAAASLRAARNTRDGATFAESRSEFEKFKSSPFFQVGIALYWAEGSKRTSSFAFINSDSEMVVFMIRWIRLYMGCEEDEIKMRVFTHKAFAHEKHEQVWSRITGIPTERFGKTIYKTQALMVKKRPNYVGCVRIELGKVKYLRKLAFWQQMLIEHYKKEG